MGAAILSTVLAVALSFGADWAVQLAQRWGVDKRGLTQDQIIAKYRGLIAKIENRDSKLASQIQNKISALPFADKIISSSAAQKVRDLKKGYERDLTNVEQSMSNSQRLVDRVTSYAYQPDSYKLSKSGKKDFSNIATAVEQAVGGVDN